MNINAPLPRRVPLAVLAIASALGDVADFFVGGMPGPWSLIIDLPVGVLHFLYAGPLALLTLTEYIPMVGALPLYTAAVAFYATRNK